MEDLNPAHAPKGYVITNEDLKRYAQPGDAVPTAAVAIAAVEQKTFDQESLKKVADKPASDAYRAKLRADAEARVQAAIEKVDSLKKQALADANPLVPPPANQTEEDKRRDGLTRRALLAATQDQIKAAQAELTAARADLDKVKQQLAEAR